MDNGEYKLLTSLERRDALLYIDSQIDAQCGQAKRLIEAFTKHPGHRDVIESFRYQKLEIFFIINNQ